MGSALDRLLTEHGGAYTPDPPASSSALDELLAQHPEPRTLPVNGTPLAERPTPAIPRIGRGNTAPSVQADAAYQGPARINPQATQLTGPARILTEYVAQPMVDNPVQTAVTGVMPLLALPQIASTAKDVVQYGAQKAAELSLPPKERAEAEADPNRIPGERAAVEAGMLALPLALHGGMKAIEHVADVSGGVSDAITQGAKEGVGGLADEAQLWGPNRRPSYTLPVEQRLPIEPSAEATGVSVGGEEMSALDKLLATRSYLEPRERLEEPGAIGRRPVETLPVEQRPAIEPGPEIEAQSFGGRVGRRPGALPQMQEEAPAPLPSPVEEPAPSVAAPVEPPPDAQTVSIGQPEPMIEPVVSANGTFEARPGVMRKVNADLPPERGVMPTRASLDEQPDVTGTRSFMGQEVTPETQPTAIPEPRPSDILNVAKLDLEDKTAQQRVAAQLEQFRAQREANQQTFAEADVNRAEIVKELTAENPKALNPAAAKRLSGEELLARRDVVRQNDQLIGDLSKSIESKTLSVADHEQAVQLMQKAIEHNDALLSDLVTGSSQKGRDLNLLRRLANRSLDVDTFLIQAKRMLGEQPLTDEISAGIRKLVQEAKEVCG